MFDSAQGRQEGLCFSVYDAGAQTPLPCDGKDQCFVFCLTHHQEKWSHRPWQRFICIAASPTLITVIIAAHVSLLLKKCPMCKRFSYAIEYDSSHTFKTHISASSQIFRERIFFSLYIALVGLTGAWLILPLESAPFPLRRMAARPIPHAFLMAKALQSRGDALTFASFCSFLMTASFHAWLSLAPKYPEPLPFLFGDSFTFSLSCTGIPWVYLGFQLSTGKRFKDCKMPPWKLHHFSKMRGCQYS